LPAGLPADVGENSFTLLKERRDFGLAATMHRSPREMQGKLCGIKGLHANTLSFLYFLA
jgi:hypothetical protein